MPSAVIDALLEVAPVFSGFDPEDRHALLETAVEETYAAGLEIISPGQPALSMFVLAEGTVEVLESSNSGEPMTLAILIPPCTFGELAFFEAGTHGVTVRTVTPVRLLSIERVGFDRLLAQQTLAAYKLALNVLVNLGNRLRRVDVWVAQQWNAGDRTKQQWNDFRAKLYQEWEL